MRLIDADTLKENLFKYSAPEMVWDRADLNHKIDEVPTIEPEQRTGVWIRNSPFAKPYCSKCLKDCFGLHGFDYTATAYCPNCGAKMKEEI